MKKINLCKEDLLLIFFAPVIFVYSILSGRLSADSFNYLIMAQSDGFSQLCMKNGEFYGVYSCGYPVLMKLTSLVSGLDLIAASKLLNISILISTYFIFSYIFNSKRLALILTLLPFNVFISTFTWSENSILLSVSLYCLAIYNIEKSGRVGFSSISIAFVAILIGCMSRYAFAPFSALMFLASYIIIKRKTLLLLPIFILNAIIFVVYKYIASATDMERIVAPEEFSWLVLKFGYFVLTYSITHALASIPLLIFHKKHFALEKIRMITNSKWGMFFITLGVGYLCLAFTLRVIVMFDDYGVRTVGFGVSLIVTGVLVAYRDSISKSDVSIILFTLILSQVFLRTPVFSDLRSLYNGEFFRNSTVNTFVKEQKKVTDNIIIPIGSEYEKVLQGTSIKTLNLLFNDAIFWRVPGMPYYRPLTVEEFHSSLNGVNCRFMFHPNLTENKVREIFSTTYRTGLNSYKSTYSPEIRDFIISKFNNEEANCY